MDPRTNPYAPGAGTIPPELAGRNDILEKASIAIDRCRNGLASRGLMLVGLRGVGKTVLLARMSQDAEASSFLTVSIETPEKRSLPALLIPTLRAALLKLNRKAAATELGKRALRTLGGFVSAMKMKYQDVEFGLDLGTEPGCADSGDLEHDLIDLFIEVSRAAREKQTAIILFIDEIQYIQEDQFAAMIMALHKCAQQQLPILLIGAGLPQLVGQAGRAKSYAERLFEYIEIGALTPEAARNALVIPAERSDVHYTHDALDAIIQATKAYPYFLQEWGKHCWACSPESPITQLNVEEATEYAIAELDAGFFRVRFDRLTPSEKKYLRAMAELGGESCRSGDIAHLLGREVQSVGPTRANLIRKGMIYSPSHGENEFTVPLFDTYLKRVLPHFDVVS